jgi:hypothetical protein
MLEWGSRQRRRLISRRLAGESTLRAASGESWWKKRARSRAVLMTPAAGAIARVE